MAVKELSCVPGKCQQRRRMGITCACRRMDEIVGRMDEIVGRMDEIVGRKVKCRGVPPLGLSPLPLNGGEFR